MIAPLGYDAERRPASIASLLTFTTLWAAAAASTQWISTKGWFDESNLNDSAEKSIAMFVTVVFFVLTPAAYFGLALVLSLRATLIRRPARAFFAASVVAISTVAIAMGSMVLFLHLATFQVNDRPISNQELLGAALGVGAFCVTSLAIGIASSFFLRLLGYRLLHRRSLLESR